MQLGGGVDVAGVERRVLVDRRPRAAAPPQRGHGGSNRPASRSAAVAGAGAHVAVGGAPVASLAVDDHARRQHDPPRKPRSCERPAARRRCRRRCRRRSAGRRRSRRRAPPGPPGGTPRRRPGRRRTPGVGVPDVGHDQLGVGVQARRSAAAAATSESSTTTSWPPPTRRSTTCEPTKPAPPVTRMRDDAPTRARPGRPAGRGPGRPGRQPACARCPGAASGQQRHESSQIRSTSPRAICDTSASRTAPAAGAAMRRTARRPLHAAGQPGGHRRPRCQRQRPGVAGHGEVDRRAGRRRCRTSTPPPSPPAPPATRTRWRLPASAATEAPRMIWRQLRRRCHARAARSPDASQATAERDDGDRRLRR